ncbi:RluA family pseudouridine synthase [Geminicoccaceae bacterium 1502E]|nr:RluA family pseudouridine synthase [Geminicoccaceae bacterium 1502E]
MSAVTQRVIRAEEAGWRFDRWCREHFPQLPHGALQKLLRTGQFRIDGKRVKADMRLEKGQTVRVPPLPAADMRPAEPRSAPRLTAEDAAYIRSLVLYQDEYLIALDKPAGLAVQGGSGTTRHVDGMLDAFTRKGERPRLVHRLDRDTSGVLVVARTAAAATALAFAFQQHKVRKLYWAVLIRGPERNDGMINLALAKGGPAGQEKMRPHKGEDSRNARSIFRVLARAGKVAAWTALMPLTGRTHQLRVHCAAIGAPILGDGKYGGREAHPDGAPKGLMLHARELDLPHPVRGRLRIQADPPPAFRKALDWLGLEAPELPGASLAEWPDKVI